jgi:hypothetical protein
MTIQASGLPFLSIHDPEESGTISLDPLGLVPLGEQMAVELVPGVRERQSRPRYLTVIAVSRAVCQDFPVDAVATDGFSEPWQVFEWYVVEAFVRSSGSASDVSVPGSQKARKALSLGLPLCASRYLKTPSIFGFHGVYRLLARTLRVEQSDFLAEFGFELLDVWQKEQGLTGFYGTAEGRGRSFKQSLVDAVKDGLKAQATNRTGTWAGWKQLFEHLESTKAGPKESELIWRRLQCEATGFCSDILDFLTSKSGQALYRADDWSERKLYSSLKKVSSPELRTKIETIERYEQFCRLIHDAFDSCRYEITRSHRGVKPAHLAELRPVAKAAEKLTDAYAAAAESFAEPTRRHRFESSFQEVAQKRSATDFVVALYDHHKRVQKAKPPEGKAPWIERHFDGSLLVRPEYQLEDAPRPTTDFVNPYRLRPLWNFATDLKKV